MRHATRNAPNPVTLRESSSAITHDFSAFSLNINELKNSALNENLLRQSCRQNSGQNPNGAESEAPPVERNIVHGMPPPPKHY